MELYTVPLGQIGRFRFDRLPPAETVISLMRCGPLVKAEAAVPSEGVLGPAPAALKRSSYSSVVPSLAASPENR
jgi:hypothetical protein